MPRLKLRKDSCFYVHARIEGAEGSGVVTYQFSDWLQFILTSHEATDGSNISNHDLERLKETGDVFTGKSGVRLQGVFDTAHPELRSSVGRLSAPDERVAAAVEFALAHDRRRFRLGARHAGPLSGPGATLKGRTHRSMSRCPFCPAMVRDDRMKGHINKVHPEESAPPNSTCLYCKVRVNEREILTHLRDAHSIAAASEWKGRPERARSTSFTIEGRGVRFAAKLSLDREGVVTLVTETDDETHFLGSEDWPFAQALIRFLS